VEKRLENDLQQFQWSVVTVRLLIEKFAHDDDFLSELAARGVTKKDLQEAKERLDRIEEGFYRTPKPE